MGDPSDDLRRHASRTRPDLLLHRPRMLERLIPENPARFGICLDRDKLEFLYQITIYMLLLILYCCTEKNDPILISSIFIVTSRFTWYFLYYSPSPVVLTL